MIKSAGLIMYMFEEGKLKVFLVHPGGPFWKNKDKDAWSIPKGEVDNGENGVKLLLTAKREFEEETGMKPPKDEESYIYVGSVKQPPRKRVYAYAFEDDGSFWQGNLNCESFIELEWPPKSGKKEKFPEVDDAGFFDLEKSRYKLHKYQQPLVDELREALGV
ncbi:MAG: NUDIX domain-containing protein [Candidatus Pacearchaeota archaeon]